MEKKTDLQLDFPWANNSVSRNQYVILHTGQLYGANNTADHMTQAISRVLNGTPETKFIKCEL